MPNSCVATFFLRVPTASSEIYARHLLKNANAARLLQVRKTLGGIESLALASSQDDESLASSSSSAESDTTMPDLQADFGFNSTGSRQLLGDNRSYPRELKGKGNLGENVPPPDRARMACRMRRLEVGRKRAEIKRRAESRLKVAKASREHRELHLTCDAGTLASAASSFGALTRGKAAAGGLGQKQILAVRDRVVEELSGVSGGENRKSSAVKVSVGALKGRFFPTKKPPPSGPSKGGEVGESSPPSDRHVNGSGGVVNAEGGGETRAGGKFAEGSLSGRADGLSEQQISNASPQSKGSTLKELLGAVDRLVKQAAEGPLGLTAFASWWVGAVSRAELELKQRFMDFSSKKK